MELADIDAMRGRIILPRYLFPASEMRVLECGDMAEIVDWSPPAILTRQGEFLFIPAEQQDALQAFAREQSIPVTRRYDVWSDLLDPFLDTEFSEEATMATQVRLRERGQLTDTEIAGIRKTVGTRMLALTAQTWEWQSYGLYDALTAMKPWTSLRRNRWLEFYAGAMEIARRGGVK